MAPLARYVKQISFLCPAGRGRARARAYGGVQPDIPRFAAKTRLAIARAAGSSSQVARRFGVTRRRGRKVRNGKAGGGRQGRLFE